MTEDIKPTFPGDLEQEEFVIAVEDYEYSYVWGFGQATFFKEHSLVIRGKWLQEPRKPIEFEWKMAEIDICQTDDDPATKDDEIFHVMAGSPEDWDIADTGSVMETPTKLKVSMWLPRSAIIALLTMLSAEGEKEVLLVGSKLEDFNSDRLTPEQTPTQAEINALLSDLPKSERRGANLAIQPIDGFKKGNLHQISFSLKNHNQ